MYYFFSVNDIGEVSESAKFTRNTTWRCADRRNILIAVETGRIEFSMNGEQFTLGPGDVLLIPAQTPYERRSADGTDYTFVSTHFLTRSPIRTLTDEEFAEKAEKIHDYRMLRFIDDHAQREGIDTLRDTLFFSRTVNLGEDAARAFAILRRIRKEDLNRENFYSSVAARTSLTELLLLISAGVISQIPKRDGNEQKIPANLARALIFIAKHYKERITVADLAAQLNVTEQHVIRLFRENVGTTPIRYINKVRVFHAIEMLRNTDLTIKQIAYELGYDDPNYFCRVFKKEEKMTPLETRRRIANFERDHIASPIK